MNKRPLSTRTAISLASLVAVGVIATLSGCQTTPDNNPQLEAARIEYRQAQAMPMASELAPGELRRAGEAVATADTAWASKESVEQVNHLAYLARRRAFIAQETVTQKTADKVVTDAAAARDQLRLAARTSEADLAKQSAEQSQRQAQNSKDQADAAKRQADAANQQADASRQQASAAQMKVSEAEQRNAALQAQIKALNAKQTERGLVITINDVLFETNRARLGSAGAQDVDRVVAFLKQYPERTALVEGFADSVGSDETNLALSRRRADAVRLAMVQQGIGSGRVSVQAHGESHPVADNESASGRQANRRVEIVVSDGTGKIAPR